ncbi:MAG: hypothetical protein ACM3IH_01525 [Sphingobacteriales bacterium]|jgi:hypothetical protein
MTLADLLSEFQQRGPMCLGLNFGVGDFICSVRNFGPAAVAMVHRDPVQLD